MVVVLEEAATLVVLGEERGKGKGEMAKGK